MAEHFDADHIHTTPEGRHFRHGDGVEVDGEGNPVTNTVTVRVSHKTSRPHTVWVEPVGWEPDTSAFGDEATHEDGAVWEGESETAGMAATLADLGTNEAEQGEEYEVKLSDLFWLSSGDCRNVGKVEVV